MNLAFYTYFYGSERNGAFKIPTIPSLKYKCFYYTNNLSLLFLLKKTKWIPIYDNKKTNDDIIQSNMMGKYIKTCPHMFPHLKEFDYLCYLDSKLEHVSETFVEDYIRKYFLANTNTNTNTNYALILRNHTFIKPNVWEEYSVSMEQHRYKIQSDTYKKYINSQVDSGLKTETPYHCQCGFLIRNMKHPEINNIGETWLHHIQMCGIQDQISFFFVKQLFSDYILPFKQIPFVPKTHDTFVLENSIFNVLSKKYKSPSMKMTINS
jgi:hypothetical protein